MVGSKGHMKTIICFYGGAGIGKTSSILAVWNRLNLNNQSPLHQSADDICAVVPFCNSTVGIASQGDPCSAQDEWLEELMNLGCEIIVCASRTKGSTVDAVEDVAQRGEYVTIWFSPFYSADSVNTNVLNNLTADAVIELIRKCLMH